MPDDKKAGKSTFWNPRRDPDSMKEPDYLTFQRPRVFDFSDVAWSKTNLDFWSQKEPMTEWDYKKSKK
ncbi:unnamed protein product [Mucor hiemalis]